jgi:hypothetical protein
MASGLAALAGALITGGPPGALGFVCGAALVWMSWRSIEIVVRRSLEAAAPWRGVLLAAAFVLKLPLLVCIVGGAAWLVANQIVSPFALVVGMVLAEGLLVTRGARALTSTRPRVGTAEAGTKGSIRLPDAVATPAARRARAALITRHGCLLRKGLLLSSTPSHARPRARGA